MRERTYKGNVVVTMPISFEFTANNSLTGLELERQAVDHLHETLSDLVERDIDIKDVSIVGSINLQTSFRKE